jgi:hypothetical protein
MPRTLYEIEHSKGYKRELFFARIKVWLEVKYYKLIRFITPRNWWEE